MLDTNIRFLKGVGPKKSLKLNKLGIFTINDLFNHYPVRYEDRRIVRNISELKVNEKVLINVKICENPKKTIVRKNITIIKTVCKDDTGFVTLTFFNQNYLMDKLRLDKSYYVFGVVKSAYGKFEMINPEIEETAKDHKAGKIMPVYGLTYGISNNELTKLMYSALTEYSKYIDDIIPDKIRVNYKLINKKKALKNIHFPENSRKYSLSKKTIAFERLLLLQIGLLSLKSRLRTSLSGIEIKNSRMADKLIESLPFELTKAQLKVIKEIKGDMSITKPMNRLVQGDVGSGKTIVALYAMLLAVDSGYQTSMMAPTEILAMQHYETVKDFLKTSDININVEFLSGSTKLKDKNEILKRLKNGNIDIIIGTHALIESKVEFKNIGLSVTDEQHRFGVRQRALLSNKGKNIDVLVMTATPIPRTLALICYGDLDISIIDELPPGRQTVKTYIIKENEKKKAYEFIKKQVLEGRQAYIVAPLVENSENLDLDSAKTIYNELKDTYFSQFKLGLLHGKMKNEEKENIINSFYKGELNILASTTVIEVGVNVPNAVVMMILNAERFGLAQLHQLRGRVGRGNYQSYCILVNDSESKKSIKRLNILQKTNNGFVIAEEDLKIRGPGDFFGTRQHGLLKYDMQNIISNVKTVEEVQVLSKKIIEENPHLLGYDYKNLKNEIMKLFKDEDIIFN